MPTKCERCEQLELLAQAYQDALRNTYMALMVALQPDTSDARRAEMLADLQEGPKDGPQDPGEVSEGPQAASGPTEG